MLALSRRIGESIMIGNDVEITVIEIKGEQVRLGIRAPKSIPIHRKEIYLQIKESNQEVADSQDAIEQIKNLFE